MFTLSWWLSRSGGRAQVQTAAYWQANMAVYVSVPSRSNGWFLGSKPKVKVTVKIIASAAATWDG
jgi:hypothetical protein